jgi:Domain of Unknown Function (DUF930)
MPITTRDKASDDRWMRRLTLFASLVLHLLIVAVLMFGLPQSLAQPQNEEAISVELVPPPEPSGNGKAEPFPVLQPVVQFGEKDAGPKVSPDGNSANDGSAAPTAPNDLDKQDHPQPPALTTARAADEAPQVETHETSAPMPQDAAKAQRASKLRQAKTLFSKRATGIPIATTAMGNVPREVRVARLCATELKEQLLHASPSYFAEILPFDRLKEGTVVENYSAAFRSNWEWYNLSYRCEVDTDATKVVSFAFDVGKRLTADEWRSRRLPSN